MREQGLPYLDFVPMKYRSYMDRVAEIIISTCQQTYTLNMGRQALAESILQNGGHNPTFVQVHSDVAAWVVLQAEANTSRVFNLINDLEAIVKHAMALITVHVVLSSPELTASVASTTPQAYNEMMSMAPVAAAFRRDVGEFKLRNSRVTPNYYGQQGAYTGTQGYNAPIPRAPDPRYQEPAKDSVEERYGYLTKSKPYTTLNEPPGYHQQRDNNVFNRDQHIPGIKYSVENANYVSRLEANKKQEEEAREQERRKAEEERYQAERLKREAEIQEMDGPYIYDTHISVPPHGSLQNTECLEEAIIEAQYMCQKGLDVNCSNNAASMSFNVAKKTVVRKFEMSFLDELEKCKGYSDLIDVMQRARDRWVDLDERETFLDTASTFAHELKDLIKNVLGGSSNARYQVALEDAMKALTESVAEKNLSQLDRYNIDFIRSEMMRVEIANEAHVKISNAREANDMQWLNRDGPEVAAVADLYVNMLDKWQEDVKQTRASIVSMRSFVSFYDRQITRYVNDFLAYVLKLENLTIDSFMSDFHDLLKHLDKKGSIYRNTFFNVETDFMDQLTCLMQYVEDYDEPEDADAETLLKKASDPESGPKTWAMMQVHQVTYFEKNASDFFNKKRYEVGWSYSVDSGCRPCLRKILDTLLAIKHRFSERTCGTQFVRQLLITKDGHVFEMFRGVINKDEQTIVYRGMRN